MQPPTPPKELKEEAREVNDDFVEVERTETVEVVLLEYEDEDNSFEASIEFEYTFTQKIPKERVLEA